jgi:hypothetical protein
VADFERFSGAFWWWPEPRDFGQGQAGEELASAGGISTADLSQKFLVCGQNRDFELRDELSGRNQPGFERTLGRDVPVSFNDRFEPRRHLSPSHWGG